MLSTRSEIASGLRAAVPIVASIAPFALLFGALAVENGLSVAQAGLMSLMLYAGASQMVGMELFGADIAPWIIVMSILAVNFRHILYSAAMGKTIAEFSLGQKAAAFFLMTDPQFAATERRAETGGTVSFIWYLALGLPCYAIWVTGSVLGAAFGGLIDDPGAYGIEFLLPLYFVGLVMAFRKRANWLPVVAVSGLASVAAFHVIGSPWHVTIGAVAGVVVAAIIGARPGRKLVV